MTTHHHVVSRWNLISMFPISLHSVAFRSGGNFTIFKSSDQVRKVTLSEIIYSSSFVRSLNVFWPSVPVDSPVIRGARVYLEPCSPSPPHLMSGSVDKRQRWSQLTWSALF